MPTVARAPVKPSLQNRAFGWGWNSSSEAFARFLSGHDAIRVMISTVLNNHCHSEPPSIRNFIGPIYAASRIAASQTDEIPLLASE